MTSSLFGTVTLGRMVPLFEAYEAGQSEDEAVTLTVQAPPHEYPNAQIERIFHDLAGLPDRLIPVTFSDKTHLDGYYTVDNVDLNHWSAKAHISARTVVLTARVTLRRAGHPAQVDLESRLSGSQTRTNSHVVTGERWHMPPPAHHSYFTSSGTPSTLSMTGAEGAATLYRVLTVGVHPRWACAPASYGGYRARIIDSFSEERTGIRWPIPATGWQVHNGFVRVQVDGTGIRIASHDGTAWEEKTYTVTIGSVLGAPNATVVVRNNYEAVTVRCLWTGSPGRTTIDLTVRRGARWVEGYIQTQPSAASIVVAQAASEATTAATGYITATGDDGGGNRYILGSAGAFTANTANRSIARSSTTVMDFMAGNVVGGGTAPVGDQATNLFARYLGVTAEAVRAVRR